VSKLIPTRNKKNKSVIHFCDLHHGSYRGIKIIKLLVCHPTMIINVDGLRVLFPYDFIYPEQFQYMVRFDIARFLLAPSKQQHLTLPDRRSYLHPGIH
jgi:hypothetical protein